ncbi:MULTISPECIES: hypothetical protein [Cysteiniphilum]|uniref:Uncharacterized protein n=1 Tax=Cysteiniphilum litorale TaxID=2056700 RepID=A0A8J2Z6C6_9GAMM|nr:MULTISPECIES: hypothetical protein [Cysteiniphilum]GGG05136.1 hypothetical protein GCM10010995_23230 [Cysteiniphilum litorale]
MDTTVTKYISNIIQSLLGTTGAGGMDFTVFDFVRGIGVIMGLCILFVAIIRLSKHGKTQQMFRYYAPSTTVLMFFAGVVLLSMSGFLEMVSTTLFPQDMPLDPIKTISEYASFAEKAEEVDIAQKYLIFSLLAIVGFISLIRGIFLLIKVSEGQREGGIGQVISHLIAGVIGMNAATCFTILNNIYDFKQYFSGS